MRFTETDLRNLLVDREQAAGEPDRVLARVHARVDRRGRRVATVVAAAVVTVAAIAVSLGYAAWPRELTGTDQPPPTGRTGEPDRTSLPAPLVSRPALGFTLPSKEIGGLPVGSLEANATYQYAVLSLPNAPTAQPTEVHLWLFEPGAYRPKTGQPLQVGGRPGYYANEPSPAGDVKSAAPRPSLTWQYTDGAWAVLQTDLNRTTARDQLVQVASRITLEQPRHARLPFRLGYLPAPLRATNVTQSDLNTVSLTIAKDGGPALVIFASAGRPRSWQPTTTIAGHPASVSAGGVKVDLGGFYISIGVLRDQSDYPADELTRIATAMTFATWTDPATWYDATDAAR